MVGASERRGLTPLEEEKRFAEETLGQEPARCEDHLGKGPKVAASPGGPRDSKEARVCGEGAGEGDSRRWRWSVVCGAGDVSPEKAPCRGV